MITSEQLKNYSKNNTISIVIYKVLAEELKIDKNRWEFNKGIYFIDDQPFTSYKALDVIDLIYSLRSEHKFKKIAEKLNNFVLLYKLELLFKDDQ